MVLDFVLSRCSLIPLSIVLGVGLLTGPDVFAAGDGSGVTGLWDGFVHWLNTSMWPLVIVGAFAWFGIPLLLKSISSHSHDGSVQVFSISFGQTTFTKFKGHKRGKRRTGQ